MAEISQVSEKTLKNKFELYGFELIIAEGHKDRVTRAIEFDHTRSVREQEREMEKPDPSAEMVNLWKPPWNHKA
jgi:hypothetical protein